MSVVWLPSRRLSLRLSVRGQSDQKCPSSNVVASMLGLSGEICIWDSVLGLRYTKHLYRNLTREMVRVACCHLWKCEQ